MKRWCLLAMSILAVIMYLLGIITDEKVYYLLGGILLVLVNGTQLWLAYRKK
jgi:hypothetical protein